MSGNSLLYGDLLGELLERVLALELLEFNGRVLIQELVDGEVAATNPNVDPVLVNLHVDLLGSELVDALRLTHEHDLQLAALRVVVDVLREKFVCTVIFDGDIDRDPGLEVDDVGFERLDLIFTFAELS